MTDQERIAGAWAGQTVVTMPAEIGMINAPRIGEELKSAFVPGTPVVVVDLTGTTFCDTAGVRMFAFAHMQAIMNDTELRLAAPPAAVLGLFARTGIDRLLPIYPSLGAALTAA